MEEIIDDNKQETYISDEDLFIRIWTSPRQAFKYINETQYDKYVTILFVLAGIANTFSRANTQNMGDKMSIVSIIGFCIIIGGLLGWMSYYLYTALVSWTGQWLNGQADFSSILRMFAYASIPSIVSLLFLVPQIGVYGAEVFKTKGNITSAGWVSNSIVYTSLFLEFVLAVWTFVLYVIGLSEVQKLSIGKSILNLLLPVIVIFVPILLLVLVFKGF